MSVDLEQFHQIFIEESIEGLALMEVDLDITAVDDELINTIFAVRIPLKVARVPSALVRWLILPMSWKHYSMRFAQVGGRA